MARKKEIQPRKCTPDPKYNSVLVARFINSLMLDGKKNTAQQIVYAAFSIVEDKVNQSPLSVFEKAIENIKPMVEVKSRRVGGSTYQVPTEVRPQRQMALAIRWMIGFIRNRSENGTAQKLAAELIDASNNRGASVKKREDTHKMAEANKAFAHYRW